MREDYFHKPIAKIIMKLLLCDVISKCKPKQ